MEEVTATVGVHLVGFRGGNWTQRVEAASRFQWLLRSACLDTYPICFDPPLEYPEQIKKRGTLSVLYVDERIPGGLPRGVTENDVSDMAAKAVFDDDSYGVSERGRDLSGVRAALSNSAMEFHGGRMETRICAAVTFQEMLRERRPGVYQIYEPLGGRRGPARDYSLSVALNIEWPFRSRNDGYGFDAPTVRWLEKLGLKALG